MARSELMRLMSLQVTFFAVRLSYDDKYFCYHYHYYCYEFYDYYHHHRHCYY